MRFRKKPVEIEAMQFDGNNGYEILEWAKPASFIGATDRLTISTLEGGMTVSVGDWVIRGVQGEFYPCKPDIFETSYERIDT